MPGRVVSPDNRGRGEGRREPGGGWALTRRGTGDAWGSQTSFVPAVGDNRGKSDIPGQDGGGCGEEGICGPPLDSMPEAVHAPKGV